MAELKIKCADFTLASSFTCTTTREITYSTTTGQVTNTNTYNSVGSSSTGETSIDFTYTIPNNVTVQNAYVYATIGSSTMGYGVKTSKINGESVGYAKTVSVDVTDQIVESGEGTLTVHFAFQCNANADGHSHTSGTASETRRENDEENNAWWKDISIWYTTHQDNLPYSNVYLLIEYKYNSGSIYLANNGELTQYNIFRAESGALVPHLLYHVEDGQLAQY